MFSKTHCSRQRRAVARGEDCSKLSSLRLSSNNNKRRRLPRSSNKRRAALSSAWESSSNREEAISNLLPRVTATPHSRDRASPS